MVDIHFYDTNKSSSLNNYNYNYNHDDDDHNHTHCDYHHGSYHNRCHRHDHQHTNLLSEYKYSGEIDCGDSKICHGFFILLLLIMIIAGIIRLIKGPIIITSYEYKKYK
jgi:hypothetical protein